MKKINTLTTSVLLLITINSGFAQTPCFPEAGMSDSDLEKAILVAFKAQGWSEQGEKVIILSTDWGIRRNQATGIITGRGVNALVVSRKKTKCITQDFNFVQSYDGSGYSKSVKMSGIGDQHKISCDCLDQVKNSNVVVKENVPVTEPVDNATSKTETRPSSITQGKDASALLPLDKKKPGYMSVKSGNIITWEGYKKDGEYEGESRMYNDEGKIEVLQHNVKGVREGYSAEYYANGKIKTEGNYKKDKQDGEWKRYNENGKLAGLDIYVDGDKQ